MLRSESTHLPRVEQALLYPTLTTRRGVNTPGNDSHHLNISLHDYQNYIIVSMMIMIVITSLTVRQLALSSNPLYAYKNFALSDVEVVRIALPALEIEYKLPQIWSVPVILSNSIHQDEYQQSSDAVLHLYINQLDTAE